MNRLWLIGGMVAIWLSACAMPGPHSKHATEGEDLRILSLIIQGNPKDASAVAEALDDPFILLMNGTTIKRDALVSLIKRNEWKSLRCDRWYHLLPDRLGDVTVYHVTLLRFDGDSVSGERYDFAVRHRAGRIAMITAERRGTFGPAARKPLVFWNATVWRSPAYPKVSPAILVVGEGRIYANIEQLQSIKTEQDVRRLIASRKTIPQWIKEEAEYIDASGKYIVSGWADAWVEPDDVSGFTKLLRSGVTTVSLPFDQAACLELKTLFDAKPRLGPRVVCPAHVGAQRLEAFSAEILKDWHGYKEPLVVIDGPVSTDSLRKVCTGQRLIKCSARDITDRVIFNARAGLRLVWGMDKMFLEFAGEAPWDATSFVQALDEQSEVMENLYGRCGRYRFFAVTALARLRAMEMAKYGKEAAQRIERRLIPELKKLREKFVFLIVGSGTRPSTLGFWYDFAVIYKTRAHHVFDAGQVNMMWAFGAGSEASYIGLGGPADFVVYDANPFDKRRPYLLRPTQVYRAGFRVQ